MRKAFAFLLGAAGTVGLVANVAAATNGLDKRFGTAGIVLLGPTPVSGIVFQPRSGIAVQSNRKIVLGGRVESIDQEVLVTLPAVARLDADGNWDTTFGDHGVFVLPHGSAAAPDGGEIHEVAATSDGILAAGGRFDAPFGNDFTTCTLLLKLDDAGTPDSTFAPDHSGSFCFEFAPNLTNWTWFRHYEGLLVGAADSIYLTTPDTNLSHGAVAHFDKNGALMSGFGSGGVAALPEGVFATLLQPAPNDAVLAIGGTNNEIQVMRLDASGDLDGSYGNAGSFVFDTQPQGGIVSPVQAALDAQHRLVISTNDDASGLDVAPYRFARLTAAGAFDETFNASGQQPGYPGFAIPVVSASAADFVWSALPLADGHLFAIGDSGFLQQGDGATNVALLRLNADSSYDPSFGDPAHPGWSSLNVYGTADSNNHTRSMAADGAGGAFATIFVNDGNAQFCAGLIHVIPDRMFDGRFEMPAAAPTCPQ